MDKKLTMKEWEEKYPFCAMMMSNASHEDKLRYAEEMFC